MKLPDEDKAVPDIARAFKPLLDAADKLFEYVQVSAKGATPKGGVRLNNCLSSVLARLLRLHYSAVKLASVGVASEAKLPIRALFELVVNLYALEQAVDKEEYARRWIAWDLHNYMRQIETELKVHPELEPKFADHRKLAEAVKREMDDTAKREASASPGKNAAEVEKRVKGKWKEFMKHGPSMVDMRSLADSVDKKSGGKSNLLPIYDRVYPNSSGVIHGSDLASMIELSDGKQIVLKLAPTEDHIEVILVTSTVLLSMGSQVIFRILGIGPAKAEEEMNAIVAPAMPKE